MDTKEAIKSLRDKGLHEEADALEEQLKKSREYALKAALPAIMARNMSHGISSKLLKGARL